MTSRLRAQQPPRSWLQSFTRRKVLAYFLIQLLTLGILSTYPLSTLALFSLSIAMPFALEMSIKFTGFILNGIASLFTRRAQVAPPADRPEPEKEPEQPEPESPEPNVSPTRHFATTSEINAINYALIVRNEREASRLFNQVNVHNKDLHSLCLTAIRYNASALFNQIMAQLFTGPYYFDTRLLQTAITYERTPMILALLRRPAICREAHRTNVLRYACNNASLELVQALLRLPNIVRQLANESDAAPYLLLARRHPQGREIEQCLLTLPALARYRNPSRLGNLLSQIDSRPQSAAPTLRSLALNRESAMASLNPQHQQQITAIRTRYARAFNERGGVEAILNDIRAFLVENYRQNPIMHNGNPLPLEYNAALPQAVQALYYANKAHTAYRYLCSPNPWIYAGAPYVERHLNGGASARIYPDDQTTLAYLWLAASDTNVPAPDGMTHAELKKLFAETILAGAGRGHNYDNEELNARAGQEVDDGQGDNPTCGSGASRWIRQFLTLLVTDPSSRALDCNILRSKCRDILIAEGTNGHTVFAKLNRLDKATLTATKTALENLIGEHAGDITGLNDAERNLIRALEPSQTAITAMVQECKDYFSAGRMTARNGERIDFGGTRYQSYEEVLQYMGTHLIQTFGDEIRTKMIELEGPNNRKRKRA